ncbi:tRNA pseudouridine32 synthase / 23S rRNA pseudouridine746 synthase/23S rRNA pseudouridine1911/1915/1917 synthase [Melghirimyces profundicolus]|uniref:Pseudouridine synthase n=1 Tax=Melghirimyces profundicolus TaxID=1242148 RepID=A0A2T6C7M7_9BACL|nr:RluA family pseudouridine synthase [Melghirimyces profundicolus]PTX64327.1 tRNA pseudouridine32 synthase / 23S rRNA pseudouridine746 synthase/23S rRNA pseudouridine1911/1915/1917 synthase [Melghirimyces profundicolus]
MSHNKWITYRVPEEWDRHTVEEVLKGPLLLSNRMINRLTRSRGIRLNGQMPWLKRVVKKGDRLQVAVRPRERADLEPEPVPFDVRYEDADLMVVDKPAGVNVHPVRPGETGTLAHGIVHYWKEQGREGKVRPVHRLDRHTSGLLMVARSAYAHQLMDRELREKRLKRFYYAFLEGSFSGSGFSEGTIDAPIAREPNHPLRRTVSPKGDPAVTHYRVLERNEHATLVRVELETGRTHQIRVHFAHLGFPLFGDGLYGSKSRLIRRQALHACELRFRHPLKEESIEVRSPLPKDLLDLARNLKLRTPE